MPGMFDDLVPQKPEDAKPGGGMFDDLVPSEARDYSELDQPLRAIGDRSKDVGLSLGKGVLGLAKIVPDVQRFALGLGGYKSDFLEKASGALEGYQKGLQSLKSAKGQADDAAMQSIVTDGPAVTTNEAYSDPATGAVVSAPTDQTNRTYNVDPSKVSVAGVLGLGMESAPNMAGNFAVGKVVSAGLKNVIAGPVARAAAGQATANSIIIAADTFDETLQAAKDKGMSDDQAMKAARKAALMIAPIAALTGGALGAVTSAPEKAALTKLQKALGLAEAGVGGAAEETAEEFSQGASTSLAVGDDPLSAKNINRGVLGGLAGGPFGAGAKAFETSRANNAAEVQPGIPAATVLDSEPPVQPTLALPAPVVRVDSQGNARRDGEVPVVTDEPPARVAGQADAPAASQLVAELQALGYDPTQRATPTPITVDAQGSAALQGDTRSEFQATEQALDEKARKAFPKDEQAREEFKVAERSRALGYEGRVAALAEASNQRKRGRGVPIQERTQQNTEPTSELGVVREVAPDGSTKYFFYAQPDVALTVKPSDKTNARAIVSIAQDAQPALIRAALADGGLEAGRNTISRGVLQQLQDIATDRFGVTRLVDKASNRAKLEAETSRLAAKQAGVVANRLYAGQPQLDLATQAIAINPKAALTALRSKDATLVEPGLQSIVGASDGNAGGLDSGVGRPGGGDLSAGLGDSGRAADDAGRPGIGNAVAEPGQRGGENLTVRNAGNAEPALTPAVSPAIQREIDSKSGTQQTTAPADPEFVYHVTEAARDAVNAGRLSKDEFFAVTRAAREGRNEDAMAGLRVSDERRGVTSSENSTSSDVDVDPDARVDQPPTNAYDRLFGDPVELTTRRYSDEYQALEGADARNVSRVISNAVASGLPKGWLSGLTRIFGIGPEAAGRHGQLSYLTGKGDASLAIIGFRNTALDSSIPEVTAKLEDQRQAVGRFIHEVAHHIDRIVGTNDFASSSSPRLEITTESGIIKPIGDIAVELVSAYDEGRESNPIGVLLGYPLAPSKRLKLSNDVLKAELFAQASRAYLTNPVELQRVAPITYGAINDIFNTSQRGARDSAHAAIRATLQTGLVGGLRRDAAPSLARPTGAVPGNRQDAGRTGDSSGLPGRPDDSGRGRNPEGSGVSGVNTQQSGDVNERTQPEPTTATGAQQLQESGRVRGGEGLLPIPDRTLSRDAGRDPDGSLRGLPRKAGGFIASAWQPAADVAKRYLESRGETYSPPADFVKVDPAKAARIADAFTALEHAPQNPEVKAAYQAMIDETLAQYRAILDSGLKVEFISGTSPYKGNPRLAIEDVKNNNHLWVYSTKDGFGSDAKFDPVENPLLNATEFIISGKPAFANDIFRVVHDYFGHIKEGVGFRAEGEENAWRAHASMYSPLARKAMTTETRGQNSWVNYGPYGEQNRTASEENTIYADQKIGLLPDWVVNDGSGQGQTTQAAEPQVLRSGKRTPLQEELSGLFDRLAPKKAALTTNWIIDNPSDARRVLKLPSLTSVPSITKRMLGEAIDAFRTAKVDPKDLSKRAVKKLGGALAEEVSWYARYAKDSGIDWYSTKYQKAIDTLSSEVPSLKDKTNRGLFTALLAITSDGTDVQTNINHTMDMYQGYQDGKPLVDLVPKTGIQAESYRKNTEFLQGLIEDRGLQPALDYLLGPLQVSQVKKEMQEIGAKSPASDYPDSAILPRAAVQLGPKLGAFYANLMGETGYLTMDRWWNRTINRYRGSMAKSTTDSSIDSMRELLGDESLDDQGVILQAQVIASEKQKKYKAARDSGQTYTPTKLETLATTVDKNARTELEDSPRGPADRQFQIDVVKEAQKVLAGQGLNVDIAAIQATIWYYEKQLFESIGVRGKGRISYEEAATNWLDRRGRPDVQSAGRTDGGAKAPDGAERIQPVQGDFFNAPADPADTAPAATRSGDRSQGRIANELAAQDKRLADDSGRDGDAGRAFSQALATDAGREVTLQLRTPEVGSPAERLAAQVKQRLGTKLVFYTSTDEAAPVGGAYIASQPGTLFINGATDIPTAVVGHEFLHNLRRAYPDVYNRLVGTLRSYSKSTLANRDAIESDYRAGGVSKVSENLIEEENMADVAGAAFADKDFWPQFDRALAGDKPGLLKQFYRWAAGWFAKSFSKVDLNSELDRAANLMRQDIAEAYAEAVRRDAAVSTVAADAALSVQRSRGSAPAAPAKRDTPGILGKVGVAASQAVSPITATVQAVNKVTDKIGSEVARLTGAQALGKKTVSLAEKAIDAESSWAWLEKLKQGLVSNYGIPEEYLTAKVNKQAAENRQLRKASSILDTLSALNPDQLAVAYQWLQEKPDTAREQDLLSRLPADQQAIMQQVKQEIDKQSQEAVKLGLISQETYDRNKYAYVHRSYKKYEAELTGSQAVARQRAQRLKGDQFKGRGIDLDVSLDRVSGELPADLKGLKLQMYEKRDAAGKLQRREFVVEGQPKPKKLDGYVTEKVWEVRDATRSGNIKINRDFTLDERQRMGEIEDARYAFAKTQLQGVRDIETARFLGWVGSEYSKKASDGLEVVDITPNRVQTFTRDQWVKVPDTKIKGTQVNRYGDLAGQYVPGVMWNDLQGTLELQDSVWDKLLSAWKISKTALSPAVHVNNLMSNFIMADLADVGVNDIRQALETIIRSKGGDAQAKALIERYQDSGAESGSFAANEIKTNALEPLLKQIADNEPEAVQRASLANVVALLAHGNVREAAVASTKTLPGRAIGGTIEAMISAYQAEDSVFRLAKFVNEINAGKTDLQAGKAARDAFLDYSINAPWVRAARRGPLPFISFTYRVIPLLAKAAATKPWKFAKYYALGSALSALAYFALGAAGDEEKEKRLLPEELQGRSLALPKMIRLPWNDKDKDPLWLDIRRWLPGGDITETGAGKSSVPLPQWLSVGGPLSLLVDFASNTDYRGNKIVQRTDSPAETVEKVSDMVLKFALPNIPAPGIGALLRTVGAPVNSGALDPYAYSALVKSNNAKSITGKEDSNALTLAEVLGVKVGPRRLSEEIISIDRKYKADEREIRTDITKIASMGARGEIDKDEAKRRMQREIDKLVELGKKTGEKLSTPKKELPAVASR